MLLVLSGVLMLICGVGHLAVFYEFENTGSVPLVFGIIYIVCSILLLQKIHIGSILTIVSVSIGIGLGVYGKVVLN